MYCLSSKKKTSNVILTDRLSISLHYLQTCLSYQYLVSVTVTKALSVITRYNLCVLYCICPISLNNCLSITAAAESVLTVAEAAAVLLCHPHPAARKNAALSLSFSVDFIIFLPLFGSVLIRTGMEWNAPLPHTGDGWQTGLIVDHSETT